MRGSPTFIVLPRDTSPSFFLDHVAVQTPTQSNGVITVSQPNMHPIPSHKPKKHKEKSRQRQHGASSSLADADADTDAHAAVTPPHPPPNAEPDGCCHIEFGDFDFDAVNAEEGGELWLVRAPSSVRRHHLSLSLSPSESRSLAFCGDR